jgi:hypothetical protein
MYYLFERLLFFVLSYLLPYYSLLASNLPLQLFLSSDKLLNIGKFTNVGRPASLRKPISTTSLFHFYCTNSNESSICRCSGGKSAAGSGEKKD